MQLGTLGIAGITIAGNDASIGTNYYLNASNNVTYAATGAIAYFSMYNGQFRFYTAPSGTVGTTATITQAMTLDASGNFMIGATSPRSSARVTVDGTSDATSQISLYRSDSATRSVYGANYLGTFSNSAFEFYTNSNLRATIDTSGNLLVGKTVNNDTSLGCVIIPSDGNTGRFKTTGDNSASGASFQVTNTSGNNTFLVRPNGDVTNTNNSYGAISDAKLKENIVDATPKLAGLMQVKVRNYNLIGSDKKQLGVVAQELEQVFPAMVDESFDMDADGNNLSTTTKSVKYSVFIPMLIKALQEQQAIIESLKARLDAANL
jgi:hypothetical protein